MATKPSNSNLNGKKFSSFHFTEEDVMIVNALPIIPLIVQSEMLHSLF